MKKIVFVFLLFISVVEGYAQVKIAVFAGPQATWSKYTINGQKQPVSSKYGFNLGTSAKVPFENQLYFSPSVFYSLKGYEVNFNQRSVLPDTAAVDNNTTLHTFELAALLQYDLSSKPNHFFIKFGPSIDVQLSGKEKFNRTNHTVVDQKMVFSFTKYGRFGANLLLQFGYETANGFLFSGQYGHGIGSINNADFGPTIRHRVGAITVGKYLN